MVLHGVSVPIVDVAYAIGAVSEKIDSTRMFAVARSQPIVCIAVDECEGLQTCGRGGVQSGAQAFIKEWLVLNGEPLPLIDVVAVAEVIGLTPEISKGDGGAAQV